MVASAVPIGRAPKWMRRKSKTSRRKSSPRTNFFRIWSISAKDSSSATTGSSFHTLPMRSLHHARSLAAMQVFRGREPSKEVLSLAFLLISGTI